MTRSEHPSVGMRAVPNPDDKPNPEATARTKDAKQFLDTLLMLGNGAPTYTVHLNLSYHYDGGLNPTLTPESQHIYDMADHVEVVSHHTTSNGTLGYVILNLWFGEFTARWICHAPDAIGVWTPPARDQGTFTLNQRERLPLWAE